MTCTLLYADTMNVHDFIDQSESRFWLATDSHLIARLAVNKTCVMLSLVPAQPTYAAQLCKVAVCM